MSIGVTSGNANLLAAKKRGAGGDERYTRMQDVVIIVDKLLDYRPDYFRDKSVFLPCDRPDESNFTRFFVDNFTTLGLSRLVSSTVACYSCA